MSFWTMKNFNGPEGCKALGGTTRLYAFLLRSHRDLNVEGAQRDALVTAPTNLKACTAL